MKLFGLFGGNDDEQAQPKDAGLPYEDLHPKTMDTSELDAVNTGMVERHRQAHRIVDGEERPSYEEIGQMGQELNQTINDMRARGYELDVPGMDEPDRPWLFYRRGR